ncbi:hypothetical protein LADH09A_003817 [Micromonospora sp. LAH09]|uniref:hypothetical protein n=1 Tax=Micromonospora cabrerizensis TaxID=2911213 RepID=UPI001EE93DC1|nr:hypothetical protein [Micromonospora cabrerizensis]MCG5469881.1 hypothetical protein [Micromonospora cabrerizensis]
MSATPPALLDGARVTMFANLEPGQLPTGATRHSVEGFAELVVRLAIARYDDDVDAYLFYCTSDWVVVTDTFHPTEAEAVAQAEREFGDVSFVRVSPTLGDLEVQR